MLLSAFCMTSWAQKLSTEVLVDRNVVPVERAATRPSDITPILVLPENEAAELFPATYTELSDIDRSYIISDPAEGAYAALKTPYRGYLVAGYFPTLDFGVSAGYRFIEKDKLSLGARLQFDSERYRPYDKSGDQELQYFATGTVGVDFSWRPNRRSEFSAFGQYDYLREKTTYWYPQTVNSGNFGAKWSSVVKNISYAAHIQFDIEKSNETLKYLTELGQSPVLRAMSQKRTRFGLDVKLPVGIGDLGLGVGGDMVGTTNGSTVGSVDITPAYLINTRRFSAKIGLKLDFARNVLKNRTNVMPDVRLQWTPVNALGIWTNITGGSVSNSFASLRQESVYQIFIFQFDNSRIPVAADAGFNIGPFKGFYIGAFAGYAIADRWLMASNSVFNPFSPLNIRGWHAGAKIGGQWKVVKGEVSAEFSPSEYDHAWYLHRDYASTVVKAAVEVSPVKPLSVSVGYEFRSGRKAYTNPDIYVGMGCISDLSAGAEWRFSPALSAFARVENILARKYMVTPWEPSKKISGMLGISMKF